MPVLHQYVSGEGCYAKAWINGAIITVQVTPEGVEALGSEGVKAGEKFPLSRLIDLLATGLAFTGRGSSGAKVGYHEAEQFVFGFDENTQAEKELPVCEESGQFGDIHLVAHGDAGHAQLLAPEAISLCRGITLSVPLDLLSPITLDRLVAAGRISPEAECVATLREFFSRRGGDAWVVHRRPGGGEQAQLDLGDRGEQALG